MAITAGSRQAGMSMAQELRVYILIYKQEEERELTEKM